MAALGSEAGPRALLGPRGWAAAGARLVLRAGEASEGALEERELPTSPALHLRAETQRSARRRTSAHPPRALGSDRGMGGAVGLWASLQGRGPSEHGS